MSSGDDVTQPSSSSRKAVDEAFQRMFGYPWGSTSRGMDFDTIPEGLISVFGSKQKVAQIMRLPSLVDRKDGLPLLDRPKDAAMLLTQRIATTTQNKRKATLPIPAIAVHGNVKTNGYKRTRLDAKDYQSIELPKDVVSSFKDRAVIQQEADTTAIPNNNANSNPNNGKTSSNLDSVLQQLAGTKQPNTVEKSNNDWESFKETDKTLQDDLERTAQSKDAYLVKQDFLNRVDQRRFEIEKSERDLERARRATSTVSGKK